jgi:hypothetical protein
MNYKLTPSFFKKGFGLCVLFLLFKFSAFPQQIPYPEALKKAAIIQNRINDIDSMAMIVGNGDINALIYSKDDDLVMHLAKNDVWDARLVTEDDPPLLKVNVNERSWKGGGRPASWNHPYPTQTPPAVIIIESVGEVKRAKLDLKLGVANVESSIGEFTVRALSQSNVFYIESDNDVQLEGFPQDFLPHAEKSQSEGLTIIKQNLPGEPDPDYKGMDVYTVLKSAGSRHAIAIVNTRESSNALTDAIQLADQVLEQDSETIVQKHENVWQHFWSKSGLQLDDNDLQNWWYRQLYYFRCLSRSGAYPIALQGGYNSKAKWHGTWTLNYNAEQTFWSAFNTNHVELSEPFIDLVNNFHPRARWYAKTVFNCEGAVTPHNFWPFETDPKYSSSVNKRQLAFMPWSYGIGTAGHVASILWSHYLYNMDSDYLRDKIYPVIKDYATFYASYTEKCNLMNDQVILGPSVDPEHTSFGWNNSPYDLAWAKYTLKAAIEAANVLDVDKELVNRWSGTYDKLPYYPVSEGVVKVGDKEDGYNIITPVVPVFPAEQVSWFSAGAEKDLFMNTIDWISPRYNLNNSVVMLNVARARMSMTDAAIDDVKRWFKGKEQSNGLFFWKAHGFYMSEQTAVAGMITEFLMQSVDNIIRIFPSWPEDKDAGFNNLRARGGFLVSARQDEGIISGLEIESTFGGILKLTNPWKSIGVRYATGRIESLTPDERGVVSVSTKKGQKLQFVSMP